MKFFDVTSESIKKGVLQAVIPEYYQLKKYTENNPWHNKQNVLDHVIAVFRGLEIVLRFDFLTSKERKKIIKIYEQKVGDHTRKEILAVAVILHDVAKSLTLVRNEKTGITSCPGHELIGSFLAGEMGKRFGFTGENLLHLQKIILYHGLTHDILTLSIRIGPTKKYLDLFHKISGLTYIDLLLLAYADMLGSDLAKTNQPEFSRREAILIASIKSRLSST